MSASQTGMKEVGKSGISGNNGHCQAIDMSEWMARTPRDVLKKTLGLSEGVAEKLQRGSVFFGEGVKGIHDGAGRE